MVSSRQCASQFSTETFSREAKRRLNIEQRSHMATRTDNTSKNGSSKRKGRDGVRVIQKQKLRLAWTGRCCAPFPCNVRDSQKGDGSAGRAGLCGPRRGNPP